MSIRVVDRKRFFSSPLLRVAGTCLLGFLLSISAVQAQVAPTFDCLIEPWETVEVSFADYGIISSINKEVSESVKKGEVLATLESGVEIATADLRRLRADLTEEISAAKATLEFSQRNLKRIKDLYQKKAVPYHKLDEAETEATVAAKRLQQAKDEKRLAEMELKMAEQVVYRRSVRSPIDGIVIKRHKSVGEYLEEQPVLTVAQVTPLRVHVLLPVMAWGSVDVGMKARVTPEAPLNNKNYTAEVVIVDQNIDVASGTFGVQLQLENDARQLPGGLKCNLRFADSASKN